MKNDTCFAGSVSDSDGLIPSMFSEQHIDVSEHPLMAASFWRGPIPVLVFAAILTPPEHEDRVQRL